LGIDANILRLAEERHCSTLGAILYDIKAQDGVLLLKVIDRVRNRLRRGFKKDARMVAFSVLEKNKDKFFDLAVVAPNQHDVELSELMARLSFMLETTYAKESPAFLLSRGTGETVENIAKLLGICRATAYSYIKKCNKAITAWLANNM